jgi:hypothetical protein
MRSGLVLVLASAMVAFACSKQEKAPAPAKGSAASPRASVGRLPVDLQPGPFGFDCSVDIVRRAPRLTPAHEHIEARRLVAQRIVEIPALGAHVPFLADPDDPPAVYVTPSEIRSVRTSDAEWAHLYATIAEDALPFEACVAHIGQESFTSPVTYTSLTIRIYALEEDLDRVMREASAGAIAGAGRVACEAQPGPFFGQVTQPIDTRTDEVGAWKRVVVDVHVWYGDYGGIARVEMRAHRRPGATVVVMAFYAVDQRRTRDLEVERFTSALE